MTLITQQTTAKGPPCLDAALAFLQKGYAVIPVNTAKKPIVSTWKEFQERLPTEREVNQWWTTNSEAGIALICGWNGLAVLDIDDVGLAKLLAEDPALQNTPTVRSPSGGLHIYLQEQRQSHSGPLIEKVADMKACGGYILVPPSTGYTRLNGVTAPLVVSNAREWSTALLRRYGHSVPIHSTLTPAAIANGGIVEGARNSTLTSIAGSLRHRGLSESVIHKSLHVVNEECCEIPLPEREVQNIAKSISRYPAPVEYTSRESADGCTPVIVCIADVQREEVQWLWKHRIPKGKLTLIDGDPSTGKSWLSLAIASALSRGFSLPGDDGPAEREPANVLLLTAEDGLADTIRPRLESMEADLSRVRVLKAIREKNGQERHLSLKNDLILIEGELAKTPYALIIIDPLNAYLGTEIDPNKDTALRAILTPLTQMAERYNVAILAIRHLTKSPRDRAIYRGLGTIGYTAAARVVHLVGVNPKKPQERVITCIKNNLALHPPAIAFEVTGDGCFYWKGETDVTAETLLGPEPSGEERGALGEAEAFLRVALLEGPRKVEDLKKEAKDAGIAPRTLERAKYSLGISSRKEGGTGEPWTWGLPDHSKVPTTPGGSWPSLKKETKEAIEAENFKGGQEKTWPSLKESHTDAKNSKEAKDLPSQTV